MSEPVELPWTPYGEAYRAKSNVTKDGEHLYWMVTPASIPCESGTGDTQQMMKRYSLEYSSPELLPDGLVLFTHIYQAQRYAHQREAELRDSMR